MAPYSLPIRAQLFCACPCRARRLLLSFFVLLAFVTLQGSTPESSRAASRAHKNSSAMTASDVGSSWNAGPAASGTTTTPSSDVKVAAEERPTAAITSNLLATVDVRLSDHLARAEGDLLAAADQDPETALDLAPGNRLAIDFVGAPRWLSQVELESEGGPTVVLVRDWHDAEVKVGTAVPGTSEGESFNFEPVPVEAILIEVPAGSAPARVFEVAASFDSRDPDDEEPSQGFMPSDDGRREIVVEWVNDYPGSSNDLSKCDDDARGLKNAIPSNWYKYEYSNSSVWEEDFKRTGDGGKENIYTDPRDLVYFSGHGSSKWDWHHWRTNRSLLFGNQSRDDAHLVPGEARNAWGDDDMEWICFSACQVLKDDSYWANAMKKLHLMMGWKTNMNDVNLGSEFGNYMVKNGNYDTALKIKQSWFQGAEDTHGSGYTARVAGETSSMGNDYLWGQGTVQSDPSVNRYFTRWTYSTSRNAIAARMDAGSGSDELVLASAAAAAGRIGEPPHGGSSLVRIPARTPRGHAVAFDPAAISMLPEVMSRFHVEPVIVNETYVRGIADRICATMGRMCQGDVGPDDSGNLWMVDGVDALLVSLETGAATLLDTELWLAERTEPASLPSPTQAQAEAEMLLGLLGRPPEGGVPSLVSWFVSEEIDRDNGATVSSLEQNIQVNFERDLDGYRVYGPGANVAVAFGDQGHVERWSEGGWRHVYGPEPVTLIEAPEILNLLAIHGSDCTINGITVPVGEITVHSISTGYYEFDRLTPQPMIEPVYVLETTITFEDTDPVQYRIFINGVRLPPRGSIDAPPDSIWVDEGTPIPFEASATGGTPPYTFDWTSDVDGYLGSGTPLVTTLSVAYMDSILVPHSITLEVTDSNGMHCQTTSHVGVRSLLDFADHDVGEVVLTVTDHGTIGFTDDGPGHQGSGLVFGGANLLYIGGPWLGTSPGYVVNRDYSAEPAADWMVSLEPDGHLLFGGQLYSDQDGYAHFDDAGHPAPRGAGAAQHSWAWAVSDPPIPEQRGIIVNYVVKDPDGAIGPEAYFGLFLDYDVGDALQNEGMVNLPVPGWGYASMWHGTGPYVGLALIRPEIPANLTLVDNRTYVWPNQFVSDEDKYLFLTAGDPAHVLHQSPAPDDWSLLASAGPFDPTPAGMNIAFALAAAESPAELETNLAALKARYDEMMGSMGLLELDAPAPVMTRLIGASPNPFNPTTRVRFELASRESVRLRVHDAEGRVVATLVEGVVEPGLHVVRWDGRGSSEQEVASGVYFLRLEAGSTTATSKAVVVR